MDSKETVSTLALLVGAVEIIALLVYNGIRQRIGKPLSRRTLTVFMLAICAITLLGVIFAPVMIAAQH